MENRLLEKKLAQLEFIHDQLSMELVETDKLLRNIGFPKGIESMKNVADDLLKPDNDE